MRNPFYEKIKKRIDNIILLMYNRFCVKRDAQLDIGRGFNSVSRRNTQEAEEAPLLRV